MSNFDQESIVYGVIRHIPAADPFTARVHRRANWSAIQSLPLGVDDEWSLLCREMFSMPGDDVFSGTYQTQLIHPLPRPIKRWNTSGNTGCASLKPC